MIQDLYIRNGAKLPTLTECKRIFEQKKSEKSKVYSVHEPAVECISKGKAHRRYEFGCKVNVAATSRGGWFVGAKAMHGNPYDGHTLEKAIQQVQRIVKTPEHIDGNLIHLHSSNLTQLS